MLDGLFELISGMLNFFYANVPGGYAVAIALLTCVVMIVTTPLTLKGTRSMIEMQRLQPEIRRLQVQYKDDRQKLNEELMRFYKEHEINPVGGCLPLLIQAPVFSILFYVVRGLTQQAKFVGLQEYMQGATTRAATVTDGFRPKYLHHDAELYQSLLGKHEMNSLGVDLAISPGAALSQGFLTALPYLLLIVVIAFLSWYQQKQIMGRTAGAEVNPAAAADDADRPAPLRVLRVRQPPGHRHLLPGLDAMAGGATGIHHPFALSRRGVGRQAGAAGHGRAARVAQGGGQRGQGRPPAGEEGPDRGAERQRAGPRPEVGAADAQGPEWCRRRRKVVQWRRHPGPEAAPALSQEEEEEVAPWNGS